MLPIIFLICLVSSEEIVKDCKADDIIYKNEEKWNTKCMKHKCKLGTIQSTFNKSCCHGEEGGVYTNGDAWSKGCWINYCKDGSVDSRLDVTCCINGNNTYKNGEFWHKDLLLYTCVYGNEEIVVDNQENLDPQLSLVPQLVGNNVRHNKRKKRAPFLTLCSDQESLDEEVNVKSWNQQCYHKKCMKHHAIWELDKNCCEFDGVAYPDGTSWSVKCKIYLCNNGVGREQDDDNCCEYRDEKYPHGHQWDTENDDCYHKVCEAGKIKKTVKKSCCEDDGVIYADGEVWYTSNPEWVCRNGEKEKFEDNEDSCIFDQKVYKNGETWARDCYTFSCEESYIYSITDHECMERSGKKCDHIIQKTESEPNALCASSGGPCKNDQQQSGVCRSSCFAGEISIGQCDGKSCICCGISDADNGLQIWDALINPIAKSTQDCILDGKELGNGRSKVVQDICITYMCSNGELLQAKIDNCQISIS